MEYRCTGHNFIYLKRRSNKWNNKSLIMLHFMWVHKHRIGHEWTEKISWYVICRLRLYFLSKNMFLKIINESACLDFVMRFCPFFICCVFFPVFLFYLFISLVVHGNPAYGYLSRLRWTALTMTACCCQTGQNQSLFWCCPGMFFLIWGRYCYCHDYY